MTAQRARESRGFKNKNPGNIDYVPTNKWKGQIGLGDSWLPQYRRRFAEFEDHKWGIRALAMLLTTYQDRHGLKTIQQIINRWAPPNENSTGSYVDFVDRQMPRHTKTDVLDLHSWEDMRELVEAIIRHELGGMPYTPAQIDEGLKLAGLEPGTRRGRVAAAARDTSVRTAATGGAVAGAGMLAAAAEYAGPVASALGGLDPTVAIVVVGLAAAAALVWYVTRRRAA